MFSFEINYTTVRAQIRMFVINGNLLKINCNKGKIQKAKMNLIFLLHAAFSKQRNDLIAAFIPCHSVPLSDQ